jgi:hypothetical protein
VKLGFAEQYGKPCVILELGDAVTDVIEYAEENGAKFCEGPNEWAYVVQFRGRPKELYSESGLRRSFPIKEAP